MSGGSEGFDMFRHFFNMGGEGEEEDRGPRKGKDVVRPLKVSLEELYNSVERKIKVTRSRNCVNCSGTGSTSEEGVTKCDSCKGLGRKTQLRRVGPGFVQQVQVACEVCRGQGETIDEKFLCKDCNGKKIFQEDKVLNVFIDKGMRENQKFTFSGEADEQPGIIPGDIVFVLQEKPHELFERDGRNLYMKKKVSLLEALTGVQFELVHLDGRKIIVQSGPDTILKPYQFKMIEGEGMPTFRDPFNKGNLYINFEVEFPTDLSKESILKLKSLLPKKDDLVKGKDDVFVELSEPTVQTSHQEEYEEYEDEVPRGGGGGGGSGCQSQ
jgi:DnaJ homolog subfamily A member 2